MSARPLRTTRARRLSSLGAALVAIALGGCASIESSPPAVEAGRSASASAPDTDAAIAASGLRVVGTYTAASGRLCRRLVDVEGRKVARASCRRPDGTWTLGRSLERVSPVGASARRTVTGTLRPDETLWMFSERLTGDPTNWSDIAELNGLGDGTSLEPGQVIAVPASLVRSGG